jgi:O-antigen/teichoic acid export membrane protein
MEEFFEKLGKVTLGVVISGVAGLLMNILLGRFLSGAEYGTFRVFFSSVLMVGGFLSFGLERRTASLLARKDQDSKIASRMSGMALIFISLFASASFILWPYIEAFLGGKTILISFVISTSLYILYKYSMGAFKGFRKEEFVGLQNIVIGLFKLAVILLVFFLGYAATEVSVLIALVYFSMVLVSAYWLRESLGKFSPSKPDSEDFKSVLLSNSKQLGEVIVLFSAPIIVEIIGGSSTQAGIIGAVITISVLPYYVYRSLIHVLLPEVSKQRSIENFEDIDSRIGFFTWLTAVGIVFWSLIGFFLSPTLIRLVFGPGFDITSIQGGIIFSSSGLLLLAALFTEVLIGFEKEKEIAAAWGISLVSFGSLIFSGNPITVTGFAILVYIVLCTLALNYLVFRSGVKFWKLDFSQVLE